MDKLEHYLDQVCRGIAGPRSLRQHIRQELREHLLDAVAGHREAGMSEDEAIERALADFGGPEVVRQELEAAHGHRLIAVVIEKAMQWKETTMKAKWFWSSWTHLSLVLVIALEVSFLMMAMVLIIPKQKELFQDAGFGLGEAEQIINWSFGFINCMIVATENWLWWVVPLAVAWLVFEWRCRSDNKPFIRLAGLGTGAVGLMVAVVLMAGAMVLPLVLLAPALEARQPEPVASTQLQRIDASLRSAQQSLAEKNWQGVQGDVSNASHVLREMAHVGATAPALVSLEQRARVDDVRLKIRAAEQAMSQAQRAVLDKDINAAHGALQAAGELLRQITPATTRPAR